MSNLPIRHHGRRWALAILWLVGLVPAGFSQGTDILFGFPLGPGPGGFSFGVGRFVSIDARVSGSFPIALQWYREGEPIPGATNSVLGFRRIAPEDAGLYHVVGSNQTGSATSAVARISVIAEPPFVRIDGPNEQFFDPGSMIQLEAVLGGAPPLALQWRRDGELLPGRTNSVLSISDATAQDGGVYVLHVENSLGRVQSNPVRMRLGDFPPLLLNVPDDTTALTGEFRRFEANVSGGNSLRNQWFKDERALAGETNLTLMLPSIQPSDAGVYRLVSTNARGQVQVSFRMSVRATNALDRWEWRNPKPQGSGLQSIAWGNGRFVAVGNGGNTITSTNGVDWEAGATKDRCDFLSVVFAEGRFVAGGALRPSPPSPSSGGIFVSSNGLDWTMATGIQDLWPVRELAWANGIFVATDLRGLHRSEDGLHWERVPGVGELVFDLAGGGNGFVAVVSVSRSRLLASTNGIEWLPVYNGTGLGIEDLSFVNGEFFAWSYGPLRSKDGFHWTESKWLNFQDGLGPSPRAYGEGIYLGARAGLQPRRSTDGLNWDFANTGTFQDVRAVAYGDGRFVTVGEGGEIASSTNGMDWKSDPQFANDLESIAASPERLVAVGEHGTVLTSTNATAWTRLDLSTGRDFWAAAWANGVFLIGGERGICFRSTNGVQWARVNTGLTNTIIQVLHASGRWLVQASPDAVATSPDGETWKVSASFNEPNPGIATVCPIAFGGGVFLDVRSGTGVALVSKDGDSWSPSTVRGNVFRLRALTYGNGRFLGLNNAVLISTNGTDWVNFSERFERVSFLNGVFVATDRFGQVATSVTGERWTYHSTRKIQILNRVVAWRDGTLVAVGNNGTIQQSGDIRPRFGLPHHQLEGVAWPIEPAELAEALEMEISTDLNQWNPAGPLENGEALLLPGGSPGARFLRVRTR